MKRLSSLKLPKSTVGCAQGDGGEAGDTAPPGSYSCATGIVGADEARCAREAGVNNEMQRRMQSKDVAEQGHGNVSEVTEAMHL